MKRISQATFVYKRLWPILNVVVFSIVAWQLKSPPGSAQNNGVWLLGAVFLASGLAQLRLISGLVDEVEDLGDRLRLRRGVVEETVALGDIEAVTINYWLRPNRAILALRRPGKFGSRVAFLPRSNGPLGDFGENAVVADLARRIGRNAA